MRSFYILFYISEIFQKKETPSLHISILFIIFDEDLYLEIKIWKESF